MLRISRVEEVGGKQVEWYHFKNHNELEMKVINYGATIASLRVPDRKGNFANIVLGCDTVAAYMEGTPFF